MQACYTNHDPIFYNQSKLQAIQILVHAIYKLHAIQVQGHSIQAIVHTNPKSCNIQAPCHTSTRLSHKGLSQF